MVALGMVPSGCVPVSTGPEGDAKPGAFARASLIAEADRMHNFGTLLAAGQTLEHRFRIANPGPGSLRLLGVDVLSPCCSAVGALPDSVAEGDVADLPVRLRTGVEGGVRRARFSLLTNSQVQPVRQYELVATLIPMLEIRGATETSLAPGEGGLLALEVVCRRQGHLGYAAPREVRGERDVEARLVGPPAVETEPSGMIRSTSRVEMELPAWSEPGARSAELRLIWPDAEERRTIRWSVRPMLRATPPAIVLRQAPETIARRVSIESDAEPIRVLGIDGESRHGLAQPPDSAAARHDLTLEFDARTPGLSDLTIRTDHPDQPNLKITVLVQPSGPAAGGGEGHP